MKSRLLIGTFLMSAAFATTPAQAAGVGDTVAEAIKNTSVVQDWLAGKLQNYGGGEVTYNGAPFELNATHYIPPVSPLSKLQIKSFRILEKMSGGKIVVKDTWSGTVHGPRDGRKAVRSGLSHYAPCFSAYNARDYKMVHGLGLPFLFQNAHEAVAVAEQLYPKYLKEEQNRIPGIKVARASVTGTYHLFTKKPVRTIDDVKGMKIRAGGGPHATIIGALGASQVSMPAASSYTALQRGTLDAIHVNDAIAPVFKAHEVTEYRTENGFNVFPIFYCTSAKFYDGLPGDLKRVYNAWSRQLAQVEAQGFYEVTGAKARGLMKKKGVKFITLPDAEKKRWEAALAPVTQAWVDGVEKQGLPGKAFIADIRKLSAKYRAMSPNEIMQETINSPMQNMF